MAADDLPLLLVRGAEHLHADGDMPHLQDRFHDLLALGAEIFIGRADEHLILGVHGASLLGCSPTTSMAA